MDWRNWVRDTVVSHWRDVANAVLSPETVKVDDSEIVALATGMAPVVWLVGKVQSGKTSIVRALTHATTAEIGEGYKPCTRTASVFDFPQDAPMIRFLDTRGLGETGYDASDDIAFHEDQAHLLLAVMRATDPQQDAILDLTRRARERHPDWPIVVAQTTLHDGYASGGQHVEPYPFENGLPIPALTSRLPHDLVRSLAYQRELFKKLPGSGSIHFVPIDFTKPGDGYSPQDYGSAALASALQKAAPSALAAALRDASLATNGAFETKAHPHIMGYAAASAVADLAPAAGVIAVPAIQSKMLHSIGRIYGVGWTRQTLSEFGACLGAGVMSRMVAGFAVRQAAKFIPIYGQTAGAAAASAVSFATTFAIGKAACYFLGRAREGKSDPAGVSEAYSAALAQAFTIFNERRQVSGAVA